MFHFLTWKYFKKNATVIETNTSQLLKKDFFQRKIFNFPVEATTLTFYWSEELRKRNNLFLSNEKNPFM